MKYLGHLWDLEQGKEVLGDNKVPGMGKVLAEDNFFGNMNYKKNLIDRFVFGIHCRKIGNRNRNKMTAYICCMMMSTKNSSMKSKIVDKIDGNFVLFEAH